MRTCSPANRWRSGYRRATTPPPACDLELPADAGVDAAVAAAVEAGAGLEHLAVKHLGGAHREGGFAAPGPDRDRDHAFALGEGLRQARGGHGCGRAGVRVVAQAVDLAAKTVDPAAQVAQSGLQLS